MVYSTVIISVSYPSIQPTENEAIDSPTPGNNEAKMPHCKIYNPMMELTTVRARERVCTYGIPVAIALRHKITTL